MIYSDIHAALTNSIINLGLGVPIAHENAPFDPITQGGDLFVSVDTLIAGQESLSKNTLDEITGIYQVSVFSSSNVGRGSSLAIIDAITDHYRHNLKITEGSTVVVVINADVGESRNNLGWYVTDISINFKVDFSR